jgi:hypothetical protein
MTTKIWRGDAPAVAQVDTLTLTGAWAANDTATLTINGKSITFTSVSNTAAAVIVGLVAAWEASEIPEFAEITAADGAGDTITLTADTAGVPFTCTPAVNTAGDGDMTLANTVANAGPNVLTTAANWSTGAAPASGDDVIFENNANDCLYNLEGLYDQTFATLKIKQSFTGRIGLPKTNAGGYIEYRPTYLKAGFTILDIGDGGGGGSARVNLNSNANSTATIHNSGSAEESGIPAILVKTATGNLSLYVNRGDVGVAIFGGEAATVPTLNVGYVSNQEGDSVVACGAGVTLTTIVKTGGNLDIQSNATTVTNYAGDVAIRGAATVTTLNLLGGTCYDESSGTFTTVSVYGIYDRRRSTQAKTITTLSVYRGSEYHDPAGVVTLTNGLYLGNSLITDVVLDLPVDKILTIA